MQDHIVYGAKCAVPGHRRFGRYVYIGLTGHPLAVRVRGHKKAFTKKQTPFYAFLRKYGFNAVDFVVMAKRPAREAAEKLERRYIIKYETHGTCGGLNDTWGGDGLDSETAKRIAAPVLLAARKRMWLDPAYRASNAAQLRELTATPEFAAKRSADMKRRHADTPGFTEKLKACMRDYHAAHPDYSKRIALMANRARLQRSIARLESDESILWAHPKINGRQRKTSRVHAIAHWRQEIARLDCLLLN